MTPDELINSACPKIGSLGGAFYFAPATVARGKELNLDGFRFYFLGRGGVLGDVEPNVVTSAFGYFNPGLVTKMWNSAKERLGPREAAREYLGCAHRFGREKFADIPDLDAFCSAAETINNAIHPAGLALYAGISAEPLPDDLPARAMQLAAVLREYRGSVHLLAVVASGLSPVTAHYLRRPDDYASFGWGEEPPTVGAEERAQFEAADRLTDELVRPAFATLDTAGGEALLKGLEHMEKALA